MTKGQGLRTSGVDLKELRRELWIVTGTLLTRKKLLSL